MKLRVGKRTRLVFNELRDLIDGDNNILLVTYDMSGDEIAALQRDAVYIFHCTVRRIWSQYL